MHVKTLHLMENEALSSTKGSLLVAYLTNIINDSLFLLVSVFLIFAISA